MSLVDGGGAKEEGEATSSLSRSIKLLAEADFGTSLLLLLLLLLPRSSLLPIAREPERSRVTSAAPNAAIGGRRVGIGGC